MAGALTSPPEWLRFRRRQVWLTLFFFLLTLGGFFSGVGGFTPGLTLVPLAGPLVILCALNARSGRRGARSARQAEHGGATCLEFPGHRLGAVLLLVVVVVSLAAAALLSALFAWQAMQGSLQAGWNAVIAGAVTVLALCLIWVYRPSRGLGGWPAVRLGGEGVEFTSPFEGWFIPWDMRPLTVATSDGQLHLVPARAVHDLSQPTPEPRRQQSAGLGGAISPALIKADLTVVAAAVSFYGSEPHRRSELSTPVGLQRVRSGELPNPWPREF